MLSEKSQLAAKMGCREATACTDSVVAEKKRGVFSCLTCVARKLALAVWSFAMENVKTRPCPIIALTDYVDMGSRPVREK
mmetsp:Transcript_5702/g.8409  ORF Transcript_5702/g.8409 Transcript_5702/m.8409 type:complete len:80 (+) Transcript_5702:1149-1388(+)